MRLPDAAPIPPNARHVTGRKRALETRRPFGREPGAFFVSSCVVVITRKLTYGNFVAIPAIAENKNTRRYWEDFWLGREDSNLRMAESKSAALYYRYTKHPTPLEESKCRDIGAGTHLLSTTSPLSEMATAARVMSDDCVKKLIEGPPCFKPKPLGPGPRPHRSRNRDRVYGEFSRLSAASFLARICANRCIIISRAEIPSTLGWIVSFILFHAGLSIISSRHFQARKSPDTALFTNCLAATASLLNDLRSPFS